MTPLARQLTAWALFFLLAPLPALAEEPPLEGDVAGGCEEGLGQEVDHRVDAQLEGGLVHLTVHRTYRNPSEFHAEWGTLLELPRNGTVHGFAFESQGRWTEGRLLAAPEAARRYEALKCKGSTAPRPIALLAQSGDSPLLSFWNLPPRTVVTVRYDLRIRPTLEGERSFFTYPLPWSKKDPRPAVTLDPPSAGAQVLIEETDEEEFSPVLKVSWREKSIRGLDARAGLTAWEPGTLGFLQLRTGHLSEAPARARVLFVVDGSHSVGASGIAWQLELAEKYLRLLPDAVAEVVVFRRSAERLFGRFVPASEWKSTLATLPTARLEPGNGSHLDEGLKLAQQVLAEGSGPARLLAFTDGRLRHAFAPVSAAPSTSAPDAAVHLVWTSTPVHPEPVALAGPLIQNTCGRRFLSYEPLELLVRPLTLEQVRLEDAQGALVKALPTIGEEQAFQFWLPSPHAPLKQLVVQASRWNCPFSLPVEIDPALSGDVGRTAFAAHTSHRKERNEPEAPPAEAVELLERTGDWLSANRSFLAVPAGAGPSAVRTREQNCVDGMVGGGVSGGISCGIGPSVSVVEAAGSLAVLSGLARPALALCLGSGTGSRLQVRVETTRNEIVDVDVTGAASEAQARCVREATWALRLPPHFPGGDCSEFTLTPER